jgi:transcriptional regulator with XRE-family HTH domain
MSVALPNEVLFFNMDHPLGRWRARYQVSQEELGRRCKLSQKAISAYESGTRVPRGDSLRRLAAETGLPLEALLFPKEFLRDHHDFLMEPPRQRKRGRPPRERPPEGQGEG